MPHTAILKLDSRTGQLRKKLDAHWVDGFNPTGPLDEIPAAQFNIREDFKSHELRFELPDGWPANTTVQSLELISFISEGRVSRTAHPFKYWMGGSTNLSNTVIFDLSSIYPTETNRYTAKDWADALNRSGWLIGGLGYAAGTREFYAADDSTATLKFRQPTGDPERIFFNTGPLAHMLGFNRASTGVFGGEYITTGSRGIAPTLAANHRFDIYCNAVGAATYQSKQAIYITNPAEAANWQFETTWDYGFLAPDGRVVPNTNWIATAIIRGTNDRAAGVQMRSAGGGGNDYDLSQRPGFFDPSYKLHTCEHHVGKPITDLRFNFIDYFGQPADLGGSDFQMIFKITFA